MSQKFDVIIIGSGFGGSVTACRLAEAGAKVLVLERGRRWSADRYPRKPKDAWIFEHTKPEKYNGWLDLRFYPGMAVALGAGVGGGSLCYSSVVMKANPQGFDADWPSEITYEELLPYYDKVATMLGVQEIPSSQYPQRYKLLQTAAAKLGHSDRFKSLPLALSFDPEWNYDLDDPLDPKHSKTFVNPQGQEQGTCIHLGNCDLGCEVKAKNTLDLNYIPVAEQHGAEVRPLHIVRYIQPDNEEYRVIFDRIQDGRLIRGEERSERVILAAGSLGSTELLLRCRDQYQTLSQISAVLGQNWSANGNVLTPDFYGKDFDVQQSIGPTISAGLEFMDGSIDGHRFIIEDDGFPNLLLNALNAKLNSSRVGLLARALRNHLRRGLDEKNPLSNVMVWLGAGVDASDGQLFLGRQWFQPWKQDIQLKWNISQSEATINSILAMHQKLSEANGGKLQIPFYWKVLKSMVTVHPLGGCKMGNTVDDGVVNHLGEVFGYKNLYVADGSIIPKAIGRNPSMTIAALAERIAHLMSSQF
ncbi:MAG: GMC family oxidoreductase [Xenococcaceae cyanobacterium MO_207.B15]|nr:GMC family oxidoreductase [Xenococcaceae cyanobacterium MO_207.B15]